MGNAATAARLNSFDVAVFAGSEVCSVCLDTFVCTKDTQSLCDDLTAHSCIAFKFSDRCAHYVCSECNSGLTMEALSGGTTAKCPLCRSEREGSDGSDAGGGAAGVSGGDASRGGDYGGERGGSSSGRGGAGGTAGGGAAGGGGGAAGGGGDFRTASQHAADAERIRRYGPGHWERGIWRYDRHPQ